MINHQNDSQMAMSNQLNSLEEMLEGFVPLETFAADLQLSSRQKLRIFSLKVFIGIYRIFIRPFRQQKYRAFLRQMESLTDIPLEIPDYGLNPGPGNAYLNREEVCAFEQKAMLGPFKVMSPTDAAQLKAKAEEAHENDFGGQVMIGKDAADALKRHGHWSLNKSGLFQLQNLPDFQEILKSPAIAHRMASLLGPDVICWRSQFFEKKPGSEGTFWHQNSAFQESSTRRKLSPTQPRPLPVIQLTMWLALTDVSRENGCMRMIPGSFRDARLECVYEYAASNKLDFISRMRGLKLDQALKATFYSAYEFTKSQVIFMSVIDQFKDQILGKEVVDLNMKAGEAMIFSSLNYHGAYPNTSRDNTRLAFVARCTPNSVKVFDGMDTDIYPTPEGYKSFSTQPIYSTQLHGTDSYGHNRILPSPTELAPV